MHGPGLPPGGGHLTVTPTVDAAGKGGLTLKPADAATEQLSNSQYKKACACAVTMLNKPSNHKKISQQAQSGMDTYPGTPRAAEMEKVKILADQGVKVK